MAAGAQAGLGGLSLLEAKNSADSMQRQAEFEAQQMEFNAQLLDIQKDEVFTQANKDVLAREANIRRMVGTQKATLAAQGVKIDGDLGAVLEAEERRIGMEDVQAIKNNSWREAMGLEIQKTDTLMQAQSTRIQGRENKRATMATAGLRAAGTAVDAYSNSGLRPKYSNSPSKPSSGMAINYKPGSSKGYA